MAKIHECPQTICDLFGKSEDENRAAREVSIQWLRSQHVRKGDTVRMPSALDGSYEEFVASVDLNIH